MATDSQSLPGSTGRLPVIENEFPAYRAVSARAVASLVFALVSVFCFTSLYFLALVGLAILLGVSALIAIRRYPEILTGSRLAWSGIILSATIGASASGRQFLESFILGRQASAFTNRYIEVLRKEPLANAVWYMQNVAYRREKSPDAILEELRQVKTPPNFFETQTHEIESIQTRLKEPNQEIHFRQVENQLVDGLTHYANALIDIDGPATAKYPDKEEFALIELVKEPNVGNMDWKVRSIRYPYKPASVGLQAEHKDKDDDGHGHSH